MKKQTTTFYITALIIALVAVFLVYKGVKQASIFSNSTVPVDNSDVAIKVFLEEMIPHHEEAVNTSMMVMSDKDITNPEVRLLAANIADKQSFEISKMKSWYYDWFGGVEYSASTTLLKTPYAPMMGDMSALKGDMLAKAYLQNMITHHEHAVMSAEEVSGFVQKIEKSKSTTDGVLTITNSHPGVESTLLFTKQVQEDQTAEIAVMEKLLSEI